MDTHDTISIAKRVIEKNRIYTALSATPEFLEWQEKGPKQSLESLKQAIVDVNRSDPLWKEKVADMVTEYQGIFRVFVDNFDIHTKAAEQARRIITESEKGQ